MTCRSALIMPDKTWKNRLVKAMKKMLAKQVNFRQNGFEGANIFYVEKR